jgi:type II secretion system protein F
MPRYIYTAKSQPHKTVSGSIDAESPQDAAAKLHKMGYFPVSVQPFEDFLDSRNVLNRRSVPSKDLLIFTRQLSSLTESGVNLLEALVIVGRQANNKYLKAVTESLISKVKDGIPLSESMRSYPEIFSGLYTSMVSSGEAAGNLEQVLKKLADFQEKEEAFRDTLRQAMAYPVFILFVSCLTVLVLLGFVIPRLTEMFADMNQALPLPTLVLINISNLVRGYWWLMLLAVAAAVFFARQAMRGPQAKARVDALKLRVVFFGRVILESQISRLMRTFSLLLSSGIPTLTAMDTAAHVLTNDTLRGEMRRFSEEVRKGSSLSRCLAASKFFPAYVANIVAVGEETGNIESSLLRIADDYEKEVDGRVKAATRLLEPVIILVMGIIVGFIVLCMLLPIFQINLIAR